MLAEFLKRLRELCPGAPRTFTPLQTQKKIKRLFPIGGREFSKQQPETLRQAARIPGVTLAAISLPLIHPKKSSVAERLTA